MPEGATAKLPLPLADHHEHHRKMIRIEPDNLAHRIRIEPDHRAGCVSGVERGEHQRHGRQRRRSDRLVTLEALVTRVELLDHGNHALAHLGRGVVVDRLSILVSVAAAFQMSGGSIESARIAVNGVAPFPVRLEAEERLVGGNAPSEELATAAGETAIEGARALRHNDYKIPMMRNLVRRAVRSVA